MNENVEIKLTLTPSEFQAMSGVVNESSKEAAVIILNKCYNRILDILRYYVDIPENSRKIIGIWILGTYFHKEFETYPFLFFNAMRGSGKTRLLRLTNYLSHLGQGKVTNNLTEAVLFRHPKHIILSIDEIEQIGKKENATLRELLNSAYKRGMQVQRMKKAKVDGSETQVIETFEPFFPICLANIWGLEEVLADRAITLILEKSSNPAITKLIEDWDRRESILDLKQTLTQISDVCAVTLREKNYITAWNDYISMKYNITNIITSETSLTPLNNTDIEKDEFFLKLDNANICGRNFELFSPLLMIARLLGTESFDDILEIAKNEVAHKQQEEYAESKDVSLYQFIAEHGKPNELTPVKMLTDHFRLFIGDCQTTDEAWCNEKWFGRALKRLCLVIEKKKMSSGVFVRVDVNKAKEKLKIFK